MNAPFINNHVRPDPAVIYALSAALQVMRLAESENGKLLAIRTFAQAVAPFGQGANQAIVMLRTAATVTHGVPLAIVQALLEQGSEMARLRRSRPPPLPADARTGRATVEATMFLLRRGRLDARLARCDTRAITEIAGRLTALGWPDDDIKPVLVAWRATRGARS